MAKSTKQAKKRKVKIEAVGEAHINATFNNIIISLTNMQGQVIFSTVSPNSNKVQINMTNLSHGIYLLRVKSESEINTYKIIRN